jgi:hypothetical protein
MCETAGVFLIGDLWHCDVCEATGVAVVTEEEGARLEPPDYAKSSRTRIVKHLGRMVSSAHDLPGEEAETIVRYVLDYIKWGLPHGRHGAGRAAKRYALL